MDFQNIFEKIKYQNTNKPFILKYKVYGVLHPIDSFNV